MKFGVYGDIHGNLEALEVALAEFEKEQIDYFVCLGDIVGYGANPCECIELVREREGITVAGNHDFAIAGKLNIDFFNSYAKEAVLWTRKELSREHIQYLRDLPLVKEYEDVLTAVHGTLNFPEMFDYIQTSYDAHLSLELLENPVCFLGHSHVPVSFKQGPTVTFSMESEIEIPLDSKTLVNIGSVGQPRDENPKASFCVFDTDLGKATIRREDYDIEKAANKIIGAGLPEILGERLKYGR